MVQYQSDTISVFILCASERVKHFDCYTAQKREKCHKIQFDKDNRLVIG